MAKAWLEHFTSLLRIGDNEAVHYDPFHFSVTVRWINTRSIELCGADKSLTIDDWKATLDCLETYEIKKVLILRVREDKTKEMKWFDTDTKRRTAVLDELTEFMCQDRTSEENGVESDYWVNT